MKSERDGDRRFPFMRKRSKMMGLSTGVSREVKSVSIVIPCFNESESIDFLYERLVPVAKCLREKWEVQLVFIDDGSTDDTHERLTQRFTGLDSLEVLILQHEVNQGIGAAMRTGFVAATGDIICTADSDCTYDPEELPGLIGLLLEKDADIATGSPYHPLGTVENVGAKRLMLSRSASRLYALFAPAKLYCYTSFFRAYRRSWARSEYSSSNGFLAVTETLLSASYLGAKVVEYPVGLGTRAHGRSKMNTAKATLAHLSLVGKTALRGAGMNSESLDFSEALAAKSLAGGAEGRIEGESPDFNRILDRWVLVGRVGRAV